MPKEQNPFALDFDTYILQSEPSKQEKGKLWQTAIGLQHRNSLVRANYTNMTKGIYMNTEYLEKFFRNLLLSESNELKNRYVHIRYSDNVGKVNPPKVTVNVTVKLTANQKSIVSLVKENPLLLQEEIAEKLGLARETVNRNMTKLQKMEVLKRIGADKNGHWEVLI